MKKVLSLLLLITVLAAGCQKAELASSDYPDGGPIVGSWKQQSEMIVYYVAGKEVFRTNLPANANDHIEFRTSGVVADYNYNADGSVTEADGSYTISEDDASLSTLMQGTTQNFQCSFINNDTLTLSGTAPLNYTNNGVAYKADSATLIITMVRL